MTTDDHEVLKCALAESVRITATYPSHRTMPESIDIVWEVDYPDEDKLVALIHALASVGPGYRLDQ